VPAIFGFLFTQVMSEDIILVECRANSCSTSVKTNNLFLVDIDRLEQGCAAPQEQVINTFKVVAVLLQLNNAVTILLTTCSEGADNLVQACGYQPGIGCSFLRVYNIM
jgi:hypothetical protein